MTTDERQRWSELVAQRRTADGWRSLGELVDPSQIGDAELPPGVRERPTVSRREFMGLLGASMALAGCQRGMRSNEKLLPYTVQPEHVVPGVPVYYATSMTIDGYATGLLAESHEGRPTKLEGNPDHPASLGAAGLYEQASILGLYDPLRASGCSERTGEGSRPASWERVRALLLRERSDRGAGLRILARPTSSPLEGAWLARVLERYPASRITFWSPIADGAAIHGAQLAFGRALQPRYDFTHAQVIVSLAADFLGAMPFSLRYAHDWATRRRLAKPTAPMNRLYLAESALSVTGGMADERLRLRPSELLGLAALLSAELLPAAPASLRAAAAQARTHRDWALAAARDLRAAGPAALVLAGPEQPPAVHALAHHLNAALGSQAAHFSAPTRLALDAQQDLGRLAAELAHGAVDTLVILQANVAYDGPADLELAHHLAAVPQSFYLGLYEDETAQACTFRVPAAHYLESWGDTRAYDGTLSLVQPLIAPLYGGRAAVELLAALAGERDADPHRLLTAEWAQAGRAAEWAQTLAQGLLASSATPLLTAPPADLGALTAALEKAALPGSAGALEVRFAPSPAVYDGRFANNAWLLELGDPLTKLTWDNAALLGPRTAARLQVTPGDLVELTLAGRRLRIAIDIAPGHADEVVTLPLGFGHEADGLISNGVGFDAYRLRTTSALHSGSGLELTPLVGQRYPLAHGQLAFGMQGRPIALSTSLAEYRAHPAFAAEDKAALPTLFPASEQAGLQWAMSVDLGLCTACSACVVACYAENNLMVTGKRGVLAGRRMDWLRVDTYYSGSIEEPSAVHQPMMCQHCEKAPCEYVCPVNATVHSSEGLNEMVYNRCVGTRWCSNNCPYKVRRFNWFNWLDREPANRGLELLRNPDVTVRERGVMEKCTYCVQRIKEVEIAAERRGEPVQPGAVKTACQQTCPTGAIQFGSLSHPQTRMARMRLEPRDYQVLHALGTRPRTHYLARIDNPNPSLKR